MKKKYILKDGLYAKVKRLDLTKWVVTKFYHYTSCARDFIAEYDPIWNGSAKDGTAWGDPYVKELYDHFQECVDAYLNYPEHSWSSLGHQNKTTIEIFNIETGEKLYLTQYDGRYYIGKSVWSEFGHLEDIGIIKNKSFTSRDQGHIDEIVLALQQVEKDYGVTLTAEINWIKDLPRHKFE